MLNILSILTILLVNYTLIKTKLNSIRKKGDFCTVRYAFPKVTPEWKGGKLKLA